MVIGTIIIFSLILHILSASKGETSVVFLLLKDNACTSFL